MAIHLQCLSDPHNNGLLEATACSLIGSQLPSDYTLSLSLSLPPPIPLPLPSVSGWMECARMRRGSLQVISLSIPHLLKLLHGGLLSKPVPSHGDPTSHATLTERMLAPFCGLLFRGRGLACQKHSLSDSVSL